LRRPIPSIAPLRVFAKYLPAALVQGKGNEEFGAPPVSTGLFAIRSRTASLSLRRCRLDDLDRRVHGRGGRRPGSLTSTIHIPNCRRQLSVLQARTNFLLTHCVTGTKQGRIGNAKRCRGMRPARDAFRSAAVIAVGVLLRARGSPRRYTRLPLLAKSKEPFRAECFHRGALIRVLPFGIVLREGTGFLFARQARR